MIGKGRFGDAYLLKTWGLTVLLGPILASFAGIVITKNLNLNEELFVFIYIQILFGFVLCIPSFLISEFLYKFLSKSKLSNEELFSIVLVTSLFTTLLTYYIFFGRSDDYMIIFSIVYSSVLIFGLYYFKKTFNFNPENKNNN